MNQQLNLISYLHFFVHLRPNDIMAWQLVFFRTVGRFYGELCPETASHLYVAFGYLLSKQMQVKEDLRANERAKQRLIKERVHAWIWRPLLFLVDNYVDNRKRISAEFSQYNEWRELTRKEIVEKWIYLVGGTRKYIIANFMMVTESVRNKKNKLLFFATETKDLIHSIWTQWFSLTFRCLRWFTFKLFETEE